MKKSFIIMLLLVSLIAQASAFPGLSGKTRWLTLDVFHQSRALPLGDALVRGAYNPGFQLSYHCTRWGTKNLTGGTIIQAGYTQFDRLFWAGHLGGGIEASWKHRLGFSSSYAIRLDYQRLFTGSNHFVLEDGRYTRTTDNGRGYLRVTPLDISVGYSPKALRELGFVPAVRFAWALDVPLYDGNKPAVWSYTHLGISIRYYLGGQK